MLPDNEAIVDNYRDKSFEANHRLTSRIRGETNTSDVKRRISRERLIEEARRVVKQVIKHPSAVDETMDLIQSTFKAYKSRLLASKKLGFIGACIYYLSAKHQLGISLTDICKAIHIKMRVISICLKQVRQLCPQFEYERANIKDLVRKHIDELATKHYDMTTLDVVTPSKRDSARAKGTSEIQTLIDSKDRFVLENRVMLLIDLFEAMHPYNQPTPQSLITAVVYHAWRSLDTFKTIAVNLSADLSLMNNPENSDEQLGKIRDEEHANKKSIRVKHSISYEKFCHICNLKYSSNGHKIVSKLQSSLLMLGKYLGDVNKINLPWYLKDIIENSPHLIQEHMRTETPKNNSTEEPIAPPNE